VCSSDLLKLFGLFFLPATLALRRKGAVDCGSRRDVWNCAAHR